MKDDTDEIKAALKKKRPKEVVIPSADMLSSGSTLINLAVSGRSGCCFAKGMYYLFVGDSNSGKTYLCLTCLAEASISSHFEDYRLIYDNGENGALMSIEEHFGKRLAKRLEPPARDKDGEAVHSQTVEDFYFHVDDAVKKGEPFVYVLDSMDVLDSEDDIKQFEKEKKAKRSTKGEKETSGSYGTSKPKQNSTKLRKVVNSLRKTGSILIIISQTRDNIGFGAQFNPKTRAGGRAMKFYAAVEIWSSVKEKIKKKIRGKTRQLGVMAKVDIKRSRLTGKDRSVIVPIYHSFASGGGGIDDVGSCIEYLVSEGHWKKGPSGINATEFDFKGNSEALIAHIESEDLERPLRVLVGKVWREIESATSVKRKSRYE